VKVREVMIIPAVQKPHWNRGVAELPLQWVKVIRCAEASMVVTSRPSARNAGVMQL
jgi:hypothetical protein